MYASYTEITNCGDPYRSNSNLPYSRSFSYVRNYFHRVMVIFIAVEGKFSKSGLNRRKTWKNCGSCAWGNFQTMILISYLNCIQLCKSFFQKQHVIIKSHGNWISKFIICFSVRLYNDSPKWRIKLLLQILLIDAWNK